MTVQEVLRQLDRLCPNQYDDAQKIFTDLYNGSALDGDAEGKALPYNVAYSYFRDGDYQNAAKWFDTYLSSGSREFRRDAGVRRADCDFMRRDYKAAAAGYETVLQSYADPDDVYPYYQLGLAYGLAGEKQKKVDALSRVRNASPSANFYPEAMYEFGRAYVDLGREDAAVGCFEALRANSKDGTYVARSLIELGMISRNRKQYDKALGYYKKVVEDLPRSEYTEDAMLAIESIYQSMGEPETYLAYAETVGDGSRKTEAEKEQIYFNSAEQIFLSENYQKALVSIQKYFEAYPNGARATEAHFYEAEGYRTQKRVFSCCGGATIYRKSILEKIGGFDERFFAYLEDVDIGFRARLWGYENWFVPSARVLHAGSASSGARYNAFKVRHTSRNNFLLIQNNFSILQMVINAPLTFLGWLVKAAFFAQKGLLGPYLQGSAAGFSQLLQKRPGHDHVPEGRRNIQRIQIQLELWINVIFRLFA